MHLLPASRHSSVSFVVPLYSYIYTHMYIYIYIYVIYVYLCVDIYFFFSIMYFPTVFL